MALYLGGWSFVWLVVHTQRFYKFPLTSQSSRTFPGPDQTRPDQTRPGLIQTFLGLSHDFLRTFPGLSLYFYQIFLEFSQDFPINFSGLSQDFLKTFFRTLSGLSWYFLRTLLEPSLSQDFFRNFLLCFSRHFLMS